MQHAVPGVLLAFYIDKKGGDNLKVTMMKLKDIKPYAKNAKKHDKTQIANVAESIKQYGFVQPIVVDADGTIVIGHCRALGAKKLGMEEVPCVCVKDLTPEQVNALRIVDNKTNESEWDLELLAGELPDIDLSGFEFDFDFGEGEEPEIIEDTPPELTEEEPVAKAGDIYQLGRHRLMCGDSTSGEDVAKLMDGALADLVVTDPPYNVSIGITDLEEAKIRKRRMDGLTIENDSMDGKSFLDFLTDAFHAMEESLKPGGAFYVWFASREHVNFETALNRNGLEVRQELIWNKSSLIMGRQDYQWKHEPCLYGWKEGAAHFFVDDRTQSTVIEDKGLDFKKMKKSEMLKLLQDIYSDRISTTVINEDKPAKSDLHPTMKPIKLIARQVKNSSRAGEKVLDLFGGSGSTLITCEQTGRDCYTMEYDPKYVDVIIKRWENLTGQRARLIADNEHVISLIILFLLYSENSLILSGGD